jgi:carbamoyltransferase
MSDYVLGISAQFHDAAAALIYKGEIVAAAAEERFSRVKHDSALPFRAAKWCLHHAGITTDDLAYVVFHEKPLRKFERLMITQIQAFPKSLSAFRQTAFAWFPDKLWVRGSLAKGLKIDPQKIIFSDHHLSHAASTFYTSPFTEAAVLTVDGVGEWASTALFNASPSGIERLSEIHFPHSIGLVYSAFTAFLGFQVNDGEAKVMGLASYGTPRYVDDVRKVLRSHKPNGFDVDLSYVTYQYSASKSFSSKFEDLFGPARAPDEKLDVTTPAGRKYADIAASLQVVAEDCVVDLADTLYEQTGRDNLCLAGGVALNSVINARLTTRTKFKHVFVHPAPGDDGCAAGAALWVWNEVLGGERGPALKSPGLGQAWSDTEIVALLGDLTISHQDFDGEDALLASVVDDLVQGKVVGWFQGRFEWGPRALGYRSILADPRQPGMSDRINKKIKFREQFRPFAPAVLEGHEANYFDLPPGTELLTPWMLAVAPVKASAKDILPATTHVDGSARVQVVSETANPLFHKLLAVFGKATGHPVLLNTSFNLKGEPIVSSPLQALRTFYSSELDVLYLGRSKILNTAIGRHYYA